MSSNSENRPSSASTELLMLLTRCATSASVPIRWRSASANRPSACSGWRRSWLAAGEEWVLGAVGRLGLAACLVGGHLLHLQLREQLQAALLERDDARERALVAAAQHH